jgi:hypothetical protein
MRTGRKNRIAGRRPAQYEFLRPQVPRDMTWDRNRATAVGSDWPPEIWRGRIRVEIKYFIQNDLRNPEVTIHMYS